jgi:hypothetical protein
MAEEEKGRDETKVSSEDAGNGLSSKPVRVFSSLLVG